MFIYPHSSPCTNDVVFESQFRGVTPLDGIKSALANSSTKVTYAQGCERWSTDQSGFPEAISAAKGADAAIVVVGTWSRDQKELWEGLNATTGGNYKTQPYASLIIY